LINFYFDFFALFTNSPTLLARTRRRKIFSRPNQLSRCKSALESGQKRFVIPILTLLIHVLSQFLSRDTEQEDAKLRSLVEKNGARNWKIIGEIHGTRDGKQCRDRWTQYLDPNLLKTAFSDEDDRVILESVANGQKWSFIAILLPGRCANDIKNYYNTHLKKKRKPCMSC
jgi:hypothetical protein